jgi:hypothetical protein
MATRLVCTPRHISPERRAAAASLAAAFNPDARPRGEAPAAGVPPAGAPSAAGLIAARRAAEGEGASPGVIAMIRGLSWGARAARLTTDFMDTPSTALRREILRHLNMWNRRANVAFVHSRTDPVIRIARSDDPEWAGYWSYMGTEVLGIPADEPTMNLEGFTMRTSQSEFRRVVCHEAGHTLGFPHEHMRREFVERIDPAKAYPYFRRTEGWSKRDVDEQVLTPLRNASIFRTPPDATSIMCYQLPGEITFDGGPIVGGASINATDHAFAGVMYPKPRRSAKRATRKAAQKAAKKVTARKAGKRATTKKTGAKKPATKRAPRRRDV